LDARDLVLKLLDDVKLIDPCKPHAHEVAEQMWKETEQYLDKIVPNCVLVGKDILYAYFIIGSVLRNTLYEALENDMPNCDDCPCKHYSVNHGGPE
jgi:hypothetical protein